MVFIFLGALYDAVGFEWSTLFTVGWNAAVFIAALCSLVAVWVNKGNREQYMYSVLEGDNVENGSLAEGGQGKGGGSD